MDLKYKIVEASEIRMEDGARELLNSPQMQPYMRYIEAKVTGADPQPFMDAIAQLPLEDRYVWRIASALKWGFADFEDWSVAVDGITLPQSDMANLDAVTSRSPHPVLPVPARAPRAGRNGARDDRRNSCRETSLKV